MVSLAQGMRDKKRLKVNEFWRGFEDFPIYFNVKIVFGKSWISEKVENLKSESTRLKMLNILIAERFL